MPSTKGLKPKQRKLATASNGKKLTGNQWQNTPQQNLFMELWLTPGSETFGNAYRSAIDAGYSTYYATQIASKATDNKWIREYVRIAKLTPNHVIQGIQKLAIESKPDIQLRAYELLSKLFGMQVDRSISQVEVTFTNNVPRPTVIDVTPD